jgi:outer membrane protein assembly factor BamA
VKAKLQGASYTSPMRLRAGYVAFCTWLLTGQLYVCAWAQNSFTDSQRAHACLDTTTQDQPPAGPEISIRDVTFLGFIQLPVLEQDEIVSSIKRQKYAAPLDNAVEDAVERIKAGWQDRGYFKVAVTGNAKTVAESTDVPEIALFFNVDEKLQYRLGGIGFKNNKALSNAKALRDMLPIKDGDIFSRKKIAKGLENLRKAYGEYGYVNYTGVPVTTFDEEKKLAYVQIDVDEGKQFYIADVRIEGTDESTRSKLSENWQ